jgi:hypothetical protein
MLRIEKVYFDRLIGRIKMHRLRTNYPQDLSEMAVLGTARARHDRRINCVRTDVTYFPSATFTWLWWQMRPQVQSPAAALHKTGIMVL